MGIDNMDKYLYLNKVDTSYKIYVYKVKFQIGKDVDLGNKFHS